MHTFDTFRAKSTFFIPQFIVKEVEKKVRMVHNFAHWADHLQKIVLPFCAVVVVILESLFKLFYATSNI